MAQFKHIEIIMIRDHHHFMRLAILEAKKGEWKTFPNPIVGAVIVEDGKPVAFGFHAKAGEVHAEINAFKNLGRAPKSGAKLFVTLEPCSTVGKTGACTEAIIASGLKHVVIGTIDPNPLHNGRAVSLLEDAGIEVQVGVLAEECRALNKDFNQRMSAKSHGKES